MNPGTLYWMDVSDASYYIHEITKIKAAEWGTPKKYLKITFLIERHLRAGEHDNQLDVVLPDHLPEVRNGVDRRILSGDELLVVVEPANPTRVDVITI